MKWNTNSLSLRLLKMYCSNTTSAKSYSISTKIKFYEQPTDLIIEGLKKQDRAVLARTITLIESINPTHQKKAQEVLNRVMQELKAQNLQSFRIGLSGPPGAGKSTFVEKLGCGLLDGKYCGNDPYEIGKLAVLAIDPSSRATGGSLLGDKTRMSQLTLEPNAYIRPSPAGSSLGGVARSTSEAVLLCEMSGHKTIMVETVGVGQSEFAVVDMVDLFVLIIPPAGGDELQGLKRGIVEFADIIVVNKADGDLLPAARRIATEYKSAVKYMRHRNPSWRPRVLLVSSKTGDGMADFWEVAMKFRRRMIATGGFQYNRKHQLKNWMWNYIKEGLTQNFKTNHSIKEHLQVIENRVVDGTLAPGPAAEELLDLFKTNCQK